MDHSGILKRPGGDYAKQLAAMIARTRGQVAHPQSDRLSSNIMPVFGALKPQLSGSFLDVGCYGGYLYPFLNDVVDYHGIDLWNVAIDAASQLWGAERFECVDAFQYQKQHDVIFSGQFGPPFKGERRLVGHLKPLARKMLIMTGLYFKPDEDAEIIPGMPLRTAVWRMS